MVPEVLRVSVENSEEKQTGQVVGKNFWLLPHLLQQQRTGLVELGFLVRVGHSDLEAKNYGLGQLDPWILIFPNRITPN